MRRLNLSSTKTTRVSTHFALLWSAQRAPASSRLPEATSQSGFGCRSALSLRAATGRAPPMAAGRTCRTAAATPWQGSWRCAPTAGWSVVRVCTSGAAAASAPPSAHADCCCWQELPGTASGLHPSPLPAISKQVVLILVLINTLITLDTSK